MNILSQALSRMRKVRSSDGFTMIELLIVITILGILATAVLSAINPIEQINRGRDTGSRSDAEQLLSAMERYNAFKGFAVWMENADDTGNMALPLSIIDSAGGPGVVAIPGCLILDRLSDGSAVAGCDGTDELKSSFVARITTGAGSRDLFVYNAGVTSGDSTYVCFVPQSKAFVDEAKTRCDTTGGIPDDLVGIKPDVCEEVGSRGAGSPMVGFQGKGAAICLP